MTDLEKLREKVNADEGYMHFVGMQVTKLEPGYCEARAPLDPSKLNPHGNAHGGFLFTLCDSAAGIAALTTGRNVVGRSAEIHFLRPGSGAYITVKSRVVKAGRHMAFCAVDVLDDQETLVASAGVEMFFLDPEKG